MTAIDNFQGEENDIILFSMVRSTNPNSSRTTIGFVKEDNRVCVSLSRAKHGFYAIGNFELIRHQSRLWESIISDVESRECYGDALPLYCCNHPETKYSAVKDPDFKTNAPNGGCRKMCDIRLPCGHACTQICHVVDTKHVMYNCKKSCARKCSENHKCQSKHDCYDTCPPCRERVEITISECGHKQMIECRYKHGLSFWLPKSMCQEIVSKTLPRCGHEQIMPCSTHPQTVQCTTPCTKTCPNGHPCRKRCSEYCGSCYVEVEKVIPECNHKQMIPCFLQPHRAKCKHEFMQLCPNGQHELKKFCCDESWPPCQEMVTKEFYKCGHRIEVECYKDLSTILCDKPCERSCEAGHKCLKLCREKCTPCPTKCLKVNCKRGHLCPEECHYPQPCKPCRVDVTIQFPTCLHLQSLECYKSFDQGKYGYTCNCDCERRLQCSHMCNKKCGQVCQQVCTESVKIDLECGHKTRVECHRKLNRDLLVFNCKEQIKLKLSCGHTVRTDCWKQGYKLSLRKDCKKSCKRILECGHVCQEKCGSSCTVNCKFPVKRYQPCGHDVELECFKTQSLDQPPPCNKICSKKLSCGHPCRNTCGEPCSTCSRTSLCRYPCGYSSKIPCVSTIEACPCKKKCENVLSCGHHCSGKCGDCYSSRMHAVCIFEVRFRHYSGKVVTLPCAGLFDSFDHKTKISCTHSGDYTNCHEPCNWRCKHFQCTKECSEECNRPPCNEPCDKELRCGHRCPGLCGERCISVCPQCEQRKFIKQLHPTVKLGRIPGYQPFFELDCGHIFTVGYLDEYMGQSNAAVQPMQCPKCKHNIAVGSHYGNRVRRAAKDVMNVEKIIEEQERKLGQVTILADYIDSLERPNQSQHIERVQKMLCSPKGCERSCLTKLFNSCISIHFTLRQYATQYPSISPLNDKILDLVLTLIDRAVSEPQVSRKALIQVQKEVRVRLTFQLLVNFKSELYRLALYAQCLILKSEYPPVEGTKRMRLTTELQDTIDNIEQYINSQNPLTQKISQDEYEHFFSEIKKVTSNVLNLHVKTPAVPLVTKGVWMTCSAGHYFCIPHVCEPIPKTPVKCPECK